MLKSLIRLSGMSGNGLYERGTAETNVLIGGTDLKVFPWCTGEEKVSFISCMEVFQPFSFVKYNSCITV